MSEQTQDIAARVDKAAAKVESVILAVLGRFASWVAPIPVAVMTAHALVEIFGLGPFWGAVSAGALELVGMTTSALWLDLKDYNRTKRKSDPEANERLALSMMITYFVIDFVIIVAVAAKRIIDNPADWSPLIAVLFPVVSAVGVIVLNQRVRHYRRLAQIDAGKAQKKAVARTQYATIDDVRAIDEQLNGNRAGVTADWLQSALQARGLRVKKRRTLQDWAHQVRTGRIRLSEHRVEKGGD